MTHNTDTMAHGKTHDSRDFKWTGRAVKTNDSQYWHNGWREDLCLKWLRYTNRPVVTNGSQYWHSGLWEDSWLKWFRHMSRAVETNHSRCGHNGSRDGVWLKCLSRQVISRKLFLLWVVTLHTDLWQPIIADFLKRTLHLCHGLKQKDRRNKSRELGTGTKYEGVENIM